MEHPILSALRSRLDPPTDPPLQWTTDASGRLAAVLVLLHPSNRGISFPLTVRLDTLTHHPGQISLPGGRRDQGDTSGWDTALREAREEITLRTGRVVPLGRLHAFPTVVSDHVVVPYVGWIPVVPRLRRNPDEVADILRVPLSAVTDRSRMREEVWTLRGREVVVSFYQFEDYVVWGVTARILSDLATRIDPGLDLGPYPPGSVRPV